MVILMRECTKTNLYETVVSTVNDGMITDHIDKDDDDDDDYD